MSENHTGNVQPQIDLEEHEHSKEPATKRVLSYGYDGSNKQILSTDSNGVLDVDVKNSPLTVWDASGGGGGGTTTVFQGGAPWESLVTVQNTVDINDPNASASGSLTGAGQTVSLNTDGVGSVGIQIQGTWTATLEFEATVDGSNWFSIEAVDLSGWDWQSQATSNVNAVANVSGFDQFRVRASSHSSGTANVDLEASAGVHNQPFGRVNLFDVSEALADGTSNTLTGLADSTQTNITQYATFPHVFNGSSWDRLRGDTNGLDVNIQNSPVTITDDGSFTLASNDGVDIGDVGIDEVISTVSTNNSTTSTLAGDATYTGTGEEVSNIASIKVSVYTDQDSATDGLQLQFSSDNSNWDISYDFSVTANQAWVGEVGPEARYFRVVYTNGSSAQSVFRLQTIYHPVVTEKLGVPIGSTIENEDNAQLVRSVLAGATPGGTYSNIGITNGGSLKISLEEADGLKGQTTMADSVPVVIASDQSGITVSNEISSLATVTQSGALPAGDNNIGNVDVVSNTAWSDPGTYIGLVTVTGDLSFGGNVTLNPGPSQIGSVTISNNPTLGTGSNYIGLATVTIGAGGAGDGKILADDGTTVAGVYSTATGNPLSTHIMDRDGHVADVNTSGELSVAANFGGNVTINPGPNQIGSVTISNNLTIGSALPAGDNNIGNVDIVSNTAWSDPGTYIGLVTVGNNLTIGSALPAGDNNIGNVDIVSNTAWSDPSSYIGLTTIDIGANNTVQVGGSLPAGDNNIGNVDIVSNTAWSDPGSYVGLATVDIGSNNNVQVSNTISGTVTSSPNPISTYTSLATVISASGSATIFTPPGGQKWVLKDLIIGSQGNTVVSIQSGANDVVPGISLATHGGYVSNFGDGGIRAKANDDAFVVNLDSAATLSVTANVRFE